MNEIMYTFKNIEELVTYFEEKAESAKRTAENSSPQLQARLNYESAAYYDIVHILHSCKIEDKTTLR